MTRAAAFDETDSEEWRQVILATDLLDKVTLLTPTDRERIVKATAGNMGTDPQADMRPGLLVQVPFTAADHAFQCWIRQSSGASRSLRDSITIALDALRDPDWPDVSPLTTASTGDKRP